MDFNVSEMKAFTGILTNFKRLQKFTRNTKKFYEILKDFSSSHYMIEQIYGFLRILRYFNGFEYINGFSGSQPVKEILRNLSRLHRTLSFHKKSYDMKGFHCISRIFIQLNKI